MSRIKLFLSLFLVVAQILAVPQAQAIEIHKKLTLKGVLEVGVAPETRRMIEAMPAQLREQVFQLLQESLPLIDKSVLKYVDALNIKMIEQQMFFDCTVDGAITRAIQQLKEAGFIWKTEKGLIASLQDKVNALPTSFKSDASVSNILQAYADLLANARSADCANRGNPAGMKETQLISSNLSSGYITWSRLEAYPCKSLSGCVADVKDKAMELLAAADKRDVEALQARQRLEAIKVPKVPFIPFVKFSIEPFEDGITDAFEVGDQLRMSTYVRKEKARLNLEEAYEISDAARKTIQSAAEQIQGNLAQKRTAVTILGQSQLVDPRIAPLLASAVDLVPGNKARADELQTVAKALDTERNRLFPIAASALATLEAKYKPGCDNPCAGRNEMCPSKKVEKPSVCM